MRPLAVLPLLALLSCKGEPEPDPSPLLGVEESASHEIPGLHARGYVLYTDMGIPHIYATNDEDLGRLTGFTIARDRFFLIDMVRRLSTGRVSELFGELGIDADIESRGLSSKEVADVVFAAFDPEQLAFAEAYAAGVNAYIAEVEAGTMPAPAEFENDVLQLALGFQEPAEVMEPFTSYDVAAMISTVIFRTSFETKDARLARDYQNLLDSTVYEGADLQDLREAGQWGDNWERTAPVFHISSTDGFGISGTPPRSTPRRMELPLIARSALERAADKDARIQKRLGRDDDIGWGSNSWAVAGSKTSDGRALLAGDGHLELELPSLMYQIHMDTAHLGDGTGDNLYGDVLVGTPMLATGTNGKVAWGFTQLSGDVSDMYAEQVQLDADGMPMATMYQDEWVDLVRFDEEYNISAALGGTARTEVWPRWETPDGRYLYEIEGESADYGDDPGAGKSLINVAGDWVIPGDTDGDGVITGITFDFSALDGGSLFGMLWDRRKSVDVVDVAETTKKAQALSLNTVAADANGDIFYSGYQPTPCRGYLERNPDGTFADGAHPQMLIDGNTYKGFTVPIGADGAVDESQGEADPYSCVIPWSEMPHSYTNERGYLLSANNDPAGTTLDDDYIAAEPWYISGPWEPGWRADAIDRRLAAATEGGTADLAEMSAIQGDHQSLVARIWAQYLLDAIAHAQAVDAQDFDPPADSSEFRLRELYRSRPAQIDDVKTRLEAWRDGGFHAASGVDTFYHDATGEKEDAIATMIWAVFQGDLYTQSIGDEQFHAFNGGGGTARARILNLMLMNRGNNDDSLVSYNDATQESAYWDHLSTPGVIEESDEIMLMALNNSLDFLASEPTDPGEGGFGTDDPNEWIWGLRHQVEFDSLIAGFVGEPISSIFDDFAITTDRLPLADGLSSDDPRSDLRWFPRPGDNEGIDAANNGESGRRFRHGNGPVMRQVFALGADGVEGVDVIPGGQSGIPASDNYADQAALWLANEALTVHYNVDDVIGNATRRETFTP